MKKILFLTKCIKRAAFAVCCTAILYSCTDIYDGIKDFSVEEKVYPAHFDTIYGSIGFERVEIDLCKAGRIPASKMKLGKAKKTIIEFSKNGVDTVIVIDSICSWVNIDGLTLPNIYRFKIYTADEFGDKSTPKEIALIPYTVSDRDAMSLPEPAVLSSTTSAQVQWRSSLSSDMCDILNWSYSYVDRDNNTVTGGDENDTPSFFIENVPARTPVTVSILTKVIPKIDRIRILDTIEWLFPVTVNITGTNPIIFLDKPYMNDILIGEALPTFSWVKVDEANDYLLKISASNRFPDGETTVIPVGNADSYTFSVDEFNAMRWMSLYWTVVPSTAVENVTTQNRRFWKYINTVANMKENYVHLSSIKDGKDGIRLEGLMNFTVEGLLKPTENFGTLNSFFGVEGYFLLRFGDSGFDSYTLQLATNSGNFNTSLRLSMNTWHHVALTYNVATRTAIVYLNGEEVSKREGDAPGNYSSGMSFVGRDVHIGKSYDDGRHFRGDMSEVRIWNVVRTKEEITNNMFNMDPNTPGLIGYWKFNEGAGKEIHDYSVNGFTNNANKDVVWKEP
ncbi:MAG: LamG domain-containing protein [Prevotellaceae bacterium]|jgi:hypothetical protein|nr:LamG domain-containing protein [Prevotellaceae bacterium]